MDLSFCCVGFENILLKVSREAIKTFPRSQGFAPPLKAATPLLEDCGSTDLSREALIPSLHEVRHGLLSSQAVCVPAAPVVWGGAVLHYLSIPAFRAVPGVRLVVV